MTSILILLLLIQLFYWIYFYAALPNLAPQSDNLKSDCQVSIIVAAKNEEENLQKLMPVLGSQDHQDYELVIIDDNSSDGTESVLQRIKNVDRKVVYHKVRQNGHGKKHAIKYGISISKHDVLLLTDADCRPRSPQWATLMSNALETPKKQIVLGYSPYKPNKHLLSKWVHFENWIIAIQYLSYAIRGLPYMGVGRNLMYNRSTYSEEVIDNFNFLSSGDDDLSIMQMATKDNVAVSIHPDTFVDTFPPPDVSSYINQKRRHLSTSHYYKSIHKILLGSFGLSQILFFSICALVAIFGSWKWAGLILLLRLVIVLPIANGCRKMLDAQFSLLEFIIYDFLLAFHFLFFGLISNLGRQCVVIQCYCIDFACFFMCKSSCHSLWLSSEAYKCSRIKVKHIKLNRKNYN